MKISYHLALFLLAAYLCALNFALFSYIYNGLLLSSEPILLGFIIFTSIFLIILASLYLLAPPKIPFKITSSLLIITAAISAYFMQSYGAVLNKDMMINVLESDQQEAMSYLNAKFILWTLFLGILPSVFFAFIKLEYKSGAKPYIFRIIAGFMLPLIIAGVCIGASSKSIVPFFRDNKDAAKLHLPYFPLISFSRALASKLQKPKVLDQIALNATRDDDKSKNKLLVFVLGETARAQNYSALGYSVNDTNAYTKPFIQSGNAKYFDALSCGTSTAISVPCMFSHASKSDFSSKLYAQNAIDFLAQTGLQTAWISNNNGGCKGVCDRIGKKQLNAQFDEGLMQPLREFLQEVKDDAIVTLHLLGSHGPTYYKRYPQNFAHFLPTCQTSDLGKCDTQAIINTYDNTILYTDFVLSRIINEITKQDDIEASLIYISDHGESLGENGLYLHGMPYALAPDFQTHVPLMFYSENKALLAQIKQGVSFSQDYIFHTLLGFFGVKSSYYDPNLDMFKPNTQG